MHPLLYTLQDHDLGYLKIIAEFWGLDLPPEPSLVAAEWLSTAMLDEELVLEIAESLPKTARKALDDLLQRGGRAPYADLIRRYGLIRDMGAGRRDRTKPWRNPISPLEVLWYRGLVARAFADTSSGAQEFIFIPTDLLQRLPAPISEVDFIPGGKAPNPKHIQQASTMAFQDATTLLASLRREPEKSDSIPLKRQASIAPFLLQPESPNLILTLLRELGLLSSQPLQPQSEPTRAFLETSKEETSRKLLLAWRDSPTWNDLSQVVGLSFAGGKWPNDPLGSRFAVLNFLRLIPCGEWWELDSFIHDIHQHYPGFLRPAGDFDSWYLQELETDMFLRGFQYWDRIDGAFINHIITKPLHLLGATDLGFSNTDQTCISFRLTPLSKVLFDPSVQVEQRETPTPISVFINGRIMASFSSSQAYRYQIARFCDWVDLTNTGHLYRISPSALQRATDQGLSVSQVKSLLEKASEDALPPAILEALSRWERKGHEAQIEKILVLRVKDPEVIDQLQSNATTARFLQERVGPTTMVVQEKDLEKLYSAAARLGILIDSL